MFLGDDGTPFRGGDKNVMMDARDANDLAVLVICQCREFSTLS